MTVEELIERLEGCDPEAEVRVATQPSWPLQSSVRGVVTSDELELEDLDSELEDLEDVPDVVWIVEGSQIAEDPYAPAGIFRIVE